MAMRNFWLEANIDGRETELAGGPRAKNGGMDIVLRQRNDGKSKKVLQISCRYDSSTDEVVTFVEDGDGNEITKIRTKR